MQVESCAARAGKTATVGEGKAPVATDASPLSSDSRLSGACGMERAAGIEPAPRAWKARVIPFHHARAEAVASSWLRSGQELWKIRRGRKIAKSPISGRKAQA